MKKNLEELLSSFQLFKEGELSEEDLKNAMVIYLSDDEHIIPNMLKILEAERRRKKELLSDTNLNLSKAFVSLLEPKDIKRRKFFIEDIKKHYLKWQDWMQCCFKIEGLP